MSLLGICLATLNVFTVRRDLALATGPASAEQRAWFVQAADRPDIAAFFKGLPHGQRVAMARAVGRYDDAPLARLCGLLLADFDADARAALTQALRRVAAVHPDAVAAELVRKGSFQTLGVGEALRAQGPGVLPAVVKMLANADARPAAAAYLVSTGAPAIPPLLPVLQDERPEVRLAAADTLGGLRAREAVGPLLRLLKTTEGAERAAVLGALASIGDPSTERLLASTLKDQDLPLGERTQAAFGLGRIGGLEASRLLWQFAPSDEPLLADASLSALSTIGPNALLVTGTPPLLRMRVASTVPGPEGDAALRSALANPSTRLAAIAAAAGRLSLLTDLAKLLPQAVEDGDLAAALVQELSATEEGRQQLATYAADPRLAGFIKRA